MYIGLEETNLERKKAVIERISSIVLPRVNEHFPTASRIWEVFS